MTMRLDEVAILLVDDVADNTLALQAYLERDGFRCVTARSGPEALEALLAHDVALALVDVNMPGMDGVELAELMRGTERTRTVPIIFVTGVSGEPARIFKGYETGAVDFLMKPVEPKLLRSKVQTFVELHRQRRQLSEQLTQLKEMLRLSDMFVAVLGHDLRSPLQSIELGAQVILGKPDDAAVAARMANTMQRASRRMARLIEQLLDFARARLQGGIPILPGAGDLGEVAKMVLAELEPTAAARIELRQAGDPHGTWDRDRISQVLSNLVGNAVQHGTADTPIVIDIAGDADHVSIEIRNGGCIPPALLPNLFDPFTRAENGRERSVGLGLGL
ncbi:MAG: hybrid sensor histidine kinase/response regulator, partial [Candidatus Binatia bacterium]